MDLLVDELNWLFSKAEDRWNFIYSDAQAVCYLLDPRWAGKVMDEDIKSETEKFICAFPSFDAEGKVIELGNEQREKRKDTLTEELYGYYDAVYNLQQGGLAYTGLMQGKIPVASWWKSKKDQFPNLLALALRVFSLAPSSAASERGFSTEGFIHSILRNRLADEKVTKLMYLKFNSATLHAYTAEKTGNDWSDFLVDLNDTPGVVVMDDDDDDDDEDGNVNGEAKDDDEPILLSSSEAESEREAGDMSVDSIRGLE